MKSISVLIKKPLIILFVTIFWMQSSCFINGPSIRIIYNAFKLEAKCPGSSKYLFTLYQHPGSEFLIVPISATIGGVSCSLLYSIFSKSPIKGALKGTWVGYRLGALIGFFAAILYKDDVLKHLACIGAMGNNLVS